VKRIGTPVSKKQAHVKYAFVFIVIPNHQCIHQISLISSQLSICGKPKAMNTYCKAASPLSIISENNFQ
jgi:hypothetical protein